jgi:CheY-like chemotaxis protein
MMAREGKLAVLVAENNPLERTLICSCLERLGVFPDAAANGREAVAATRIRTYDLIIMACRMPVLDGPAAALEIRAGETGKTGGSRKARIIGMSAEVSASSPREAIPPGMDALAGFPLDEAVLREQVGLALRAFSN